MTTKLIFVTGNANKLREVRTILSSSSSSPFDLESRDLDLPELQGTIKEVASAKVVAASAVVGGACITEDTALCFGAMGELPGPYIKYFMLQLGHSGLNKMLAGFTDKSATAVCTFAYTKGPGHEPILFEGRTEGTIVEARGPSNFGWDPIFEVSGTGLTYAEMSSEQKNGLSHRYKALDLLRTYLLSEESK